MKKDNTTSTDSKRQAQVKKIDRRIKEKPDADGNQSSSNTLPLPVNDDGLKSV